MFGRKKRREALGLGPIVDEAEPLIMVAEYEATNGNADLRTADGDFDLRGLTDAVFTGGLVPAARMLSCIGDNAEKFWHGSNLDDQWKKGSRDEREKAFTTVMQFQNALDGAEYDDPHVLALHATMRLKALLLAVGCDATYRTNLLDRIASDPMQFGVREMPTR
jgi:hypothetical protein